VLRDRRRKCFISATRQLLEDYISSKADELNMIMAHWGLIIRRGHPNVTLSRRNHT